MANFDMKTFLLLRMALAAKAQGIDIDTSDASQWAALMGRPGLNWTAGLGDLINNDDIARDLRKADQMTFDQVAAYASNFFVAPKSGASSTGTVNIFFKVPQVVNVVVGQRFTASNGARFFASTAVQMSEAQVAAQYDSNNGGYRVNVPGVTSSSSGPDFSIKAGSIVAMDNQTDNVLLVTNLADFSKSVAAETKLQLAARIKNSASMRSMVSADSTTALLADDPRINGNAITVIGSGDIEMQRDILFDGIHGNGQQDTYIYSAQPLETLTLDQPIALDSLPTFVFYGHDITAGVLDPTIAIGANAGPVVAVQKVEYGTGTGNGFLPIGVLANGEDYVFDFPSGSSAATKNSSEEFWRIQLIKRPPSPSTTVRATVLRNQLPSILQSELPGMGPRAPAHSTLFKAFTVALLDVSASVRPLPGASADPAVYEAAIAGLIATTPIAGEIDESDIIDILVRAGADQVIVPLSAEARVFYPDLVEKFVQMTSDVRGSDFDRGPYTARTIGFVPGIITVEVRT